MRAAFFPMIRASRHREYDDQSSAIDRHWGRMNEFSEYEERAVDILYDEVPKN